LPRKQPQGKIDRAKLNVNGGSIAIGHPFAATGARIVSSLAKLLEQRGSGWGLRRLLSGDAPHFEGCVRYLTELSPG